MMSMDFPYPIRKRGSLNMKATLSK